MHHIDFTGEHFSVRGPSIVPRPPQGQPPVMSLAHARVPYAFAARSCDAVWVTPHDRAGAAAVLAQVDTAVGRVGRDTRARPLLRFAELLVVLDAEPGAAARRKARLDALAGAELASDAEVFTGTPGELADVLLDWREAGLDGFRLRPATLPHDLLEITRGLVPELRRRGAFRTAYDATTLRGHLCLPRPASRYPEPTRTPADGERGAGATGRGERPSARSGRSAGQAPVGPGRAGRRRLVVRGPRGAPGLRTRRRGGRLPPPPASPAPRGPGPRRRCRRPS